MTIKTRQIEWTAEQVCGQCGEGVFVAVGTERLPICNECGHMHPMERHNLDENECFEWKHTTQARGEQTLHVISYLPQY